MEHRRPPSPNHSATPPNESDRSLSRGELLLRSKSSRDTNAVAEHISPSPTTPQSAVSELAYQHYQHYSKEPWQNPHSHQQYLPTYALHRQQHRHHYGHYHREPRLPQRFSKPEFQPEHQQPLSPHMQSQVKAQPRVLPGVYHSPLAPTTTARSAPRLPPISMLTAASMQPRVQPQPLPRQVSSEYSIQTREAVTPTRGRAPPQPQVPVHADDQKNLCRYRNKRCGYPRAIKRNGDRHNLCEKHRAKANQNQRKLESKRRIQKKAPGAHSGAAGEPQVGAHLDPHHLELLRTQQTSQFSSSASSALHHGTASASGLSYPRYRGMSSPSDDASCSSSFGSVAC